jgi:hypothetical protein
MVIKETLETGSPIINQPLVESFVGDDLIEGIRSYDAGEALVADEKVRKEINSQFRVFLHS